MIFFDSADGQPLFTKQEFPRLAVTRKGKGIQSKAHRKIFRLLCSVNFILNGRYIRCAAVVKGSLQNNTLVGSTGEQELDGMSRRDREVTALDRHQLFRCHAVFGSDIAVTVIHRVL